MEVRGQTAVGRLVAPQKIRPRFLKKKERDPWHKAGAGELLSPRGTRSLGHRVEATLNNAAAETTANLVGTSGSCLRPGAPGVDGGAAGVVPSRLAPSVEAAVKPSLRAQPAEAAAHHPPEGSLQSVSKESSKGAGNFEVGPLPPRGCASPARNRQPVA